MWSEIIQCIIAVAGITLGIVWAWKKRSAPLDRIQTWLGLATSVCCILVIISMRVQSDWLELILLILAWQLVPWYWIVLWRQIVNKEGQAPAKDQVECVPRDELK